MKTHGSLQSHAGVVKKVYKTPRKQVHRLMGAEKEVSKIYHKEPLKIFGEITLLVALAFGQFHLQKKQMDYGTDFVLPYDQEVRVFSEEAIKIFSFSQKETLSDFLWLRIQQDPSLHHVREGERASIFWDLDLGTSLDPLYMNLFRFGGMLLTVVRDDNEGAKIILEKARKNMESSKFQEKSAEFLENFWPDQWHLYSLLGYVYLYELDDLKKAADAFLQGSKKPHAPHYMKLLSERLSKPFGIFEVGERLLLAFLRDAEKNENLVLQKELEKKIISLRLLRSLEEINMKFLNSHQTPSKEKAEEFLKKNQLFHDEFGGKIFVNPKGSPRWFESTTKRVKVFGIE